MATKTAFGLAAFALLFLTFLAPATQAQGLPPQAAVSPPAGGIGDPCRWWEESLALVDGAHGGLFLPVDVDGTFALIQVAAAAPADALGAEEPCAGGALTPCTTPSAEEGLAILPGWIGCYQLRDAPSELGAAKCPLDDLLNLDELAADVPCLEGYEVPELCKPATDCLPDPCGATLLLGSPSQAAETDCLPCQPASECVPENPCQPAAECVPDPCGATILGAPRQDAGTECLPCQPAAECIPENPCEPASECIPPPCPTLRVVPGQCGTDPVDECDYLRLVPGQCGTPPFDACDYLGPQMPQARIGLPCGGSIEECDYLRFVPGQCDTPPFDPCEPIANLGQASAAPEAGGDIVVDGPCGPIVIPGYCRFLGSTAGFCGNPPPDPCEMVYPQASAADAAPEAGGDIVVDGPCGPIVIPGYCRFLGSTAGFCGNPPLDPCDPLVTFNSSPPTGGGFVIHGPCGPIPVPGPCDLKADTPFVCVPGPDPCVREKGGECYTLRGLVYTVAQLIHGKEIDEDLDRMGDEWERRVVGTIDYLVDWALDLDHDGLKNLDEFRWDTHPLDPDTDDDGVQDGPEAAYWDRTPDQAVALDSGVALRDADSKTDTDGDGKPNILDPDSDDDHLLDGEEYYGTYSAGVRTFLEFPDSDLQGAGDGLTDYQEVRDRDGSPASGVDGGFGTLPMDEDSDDDLVLDGDEAARWGAQWNTEFDCSPGSNNLRDADADGDTLTDGAEWDQHVTDPRDVDSDGDVMDDGYEVLKGFVPSNGADGSNDVDGDGLTSAFEYAFGQTSGYRVCAFGPYLHGFDPHVGDMDGDTLTDGDELSGRFNAYKGDAAYAGYPGSTNVRRPDSDFEGFGDAHEMLTLATNPNSADSDGDGLTDYFEIVTYGTDPKDADSDNDGLSDGDEFRADVDPHNPDSDGDGSADGADSNPGRETIPPVYPGGTEAYLVFREDGYIDVIIEDVNSDEVNLEAVTLSGNLVAQGANGAALPALNFNMEATRGDDGIWGARVGIPPGVQTVTQETVRLMAIDQNGNAWASVGTFNNVLRSPAWASTPQQVRDANDWATLIEHQSPANTDVPSTTGMATLVPGAHGTSWYDPAGATGAITIYRVDMTAFAPLQELDTQFGRQAVLIAEDGFDWVDPSLEPDLYEQTAFGFKWKAPKYLFKGIQNGAKEFLDSAYKTTESALREAQYQSASFILGSDHPAAHGRSAGDFVGGFLLWGDFRDCIIRPTYINPQTDAAKIIDAAITLLSCTGLAVDVAQATPGAPAAVAANAAMTAIKIVLKKLVRLDAQLALHFVDMIKVCTGSLAVCPAVGGLAKLAKSDTTNRLGVKQFIDAVGVDDAARFEKAFPKSVERASRIQSDFHGATQRGFDEFTTVVAASHKPLGTWNADQTLNRVLARSDEFKAVQGVDPGLAPQFLSDISRAITKAQPGVSKIPASDLEAFLRANLNEGSFYEMRYVTKQLDLGKTVSVFARKYAPGGETVEVWQGGQRIGTKTMAGEIDAAIGASPSMIRVEVKKSASSIDLAQVRDQAGHLKASSQFGDEYHLVSGTAPSPTQLSGLQTIAKDYAITVRVFDQATGQKWAYGPNGNPIP